MKMDRVRRITLLVTFVMIFAMTATAIDTEQSYAAPKKKPLIAVAAMYKSNAMPMVKKLRKWGFRAKWVRTSKINVNKYDGLVIPGGGDVTPSLYHEKRHRKTYSTNLKRDKLQIALIKKFSKKKKPVLGVCRGLQIINVAFGGTLNQHIGRTHWNGKKIKTKNVKGTWTYEIYGKSKTVKCSHHQCIRKLGKGLVVTQRCAKDNRIEAIQHKTLPVFAVQYHFEKMGKYGSPIAKRFKKECLERMK